MMCASVGRQRACSPASISKESVGNAGAALTTFWGVDLSAARTAAASHARSSSLPGLYRSLAKPHIMVARSWGLACPMRRAACAAHAARSVSPGWWCMDANPCTMLATQRAGSSLALRAAKCARCLCHSMHRHRVNSFML